uniref:Cell cycle control protein 50A n=1 Tax=Strombidium inclinatum TaxID=197538 RepID=A0A7S3IY80_9SPIT|mmetsp:Transcript_42695/g.65520  ORF Transcript_42695/g.65520 Transcript_42695/m.65520 type:complete len:177 (+) Transcript_42695:530-1060(+)
MNPDAPATPCGLVAKSFFNDTFELYKKGINGAADSKVTINKDDIAWDSDVQYKFKNVEKGLSGGTTWKELQWIDMENQDFIVWMRTAGLPNFRKLWGRIEGNMEKGDYYIKVDNQYKVSPFQGKKSFVISTTNALGGKNYFLAICYMIVGVLCMLFALIFCFAYMKKRNNGAQNNA